MATIKIWRLTLFVLGLSLSDALLAASCNYLVRNEWSTGFTADFTITNTDSEPLDSWSVSWTYSDGSSVSNAWNVQLSGDNPFIGSSFNWNGYIAPGDSVTFGFNGVKGLANEPAAMPELGGDCGETPVNQAPTANISANTTSGNIPLVVSFDAGASSDPEGAALSYSWDFGGGDTDTGAVVTRTYESAGSYPVTLVVNDGELDSAAATVTIVAEDEGTEDVYQLDASRSSLYFISAKNSHVVETHTFTALSGGISDEGLATLRINLDSIESGIDIRNERMRSLLFETLNFPEAVVSLPVDLDEQSTQAIGSAETKTVTASLNLHGLVSTIVTDVIVTKISASEFLVQSASPILLDAADHGLDVGIEALRAVAGLNVIGTTVPVNFTLVYTTP